MLQCQIKSYVCYIPKILRVSFSVTLLKSLFFSSSTWMSRTPNKSRIAILPVFLAAWTTSWLNSWFLAIFFRSLTQGTDSDLRQFIIKLSKLLILSASKSLRIACFPNSVALSAKMLVRLSSFCTLKIWHFSSKYYLIWNYNSPVKDKLSNNITDSDACWTAQHLQTFF